MATPGLQSVVAGGFLKETPTPFLDFGSQDYNFSGAAVVKRVPAGMPALLIKMWAGSGAGGIAGGIRNSGAGGFMWALLDVAENDIIEIWVGGGGDTGDGTNGGLGGWPDGGFGGRASDTNDGPGGGGSSRVYKNGILALIVGGGSGGGMTSAVGGIGTGGDGGGALPEAVTGGIAGRGYNTAADFSTGYGHAGGVAAGGANDLDSGRNGSFLQGGKGSDEADNLTIDTLAGVGGAGGYYGAAGGYDQRAAGGGSSFYSTDPDAGVVWCHILPNMATYSAPTVAGMPMGQYVGGYNGSAGKPVMANFTDGANGLIVVYGYDTMEDQLIPLSWQGDHGVSLSATVGTTYLTRSVCADDATISEIKVYANEIDAVTTLRGVVYSELAGSPFRLLGYTNVQTGITVGVQTLALVADVDVPAGTPVWVGFAVDASQMTTIRGPDPLPYELESATWLMGANDVPYQTVGPSKNVRVANTIQVLTWAEGKRTTGLTPPADLEIAVGCSTVYSSSTTIASGGGHGVLAVVPCDMVIDSIRVRPVETDGSTRYRGVVRSTSGTTTQVPATVLASTNIVTGVTNNVEVDLPLTAPLTVAEGDTIWICLEVETSTLSLAAVLTSGKAATWSGVDIDSAPTNSPTASASGTKPAIWGVGNADDPTVELVGTFVLDASSQSVPAADAKAVIKVRVHEGGSVTSMWAGYVQVDNASALIKAIIYADNSGVPGALLATGTEVTGTNGGKWLELPISYTFAPGDYWIGVISDTTLTVGVTDDRGSFVSSADTYAGGPADPFGTPTTNSNASPAFHMVLTP